MITEANHCWAGRAGYALDCCGNDIALSCPQPLDINAMIRDQKLDCGNPCGDSDEVSKYFLYVNHGETPKQLVAPYPN